MGTPNFRDTVTKDVGTPNFQDIAAGRLEDINSSAQVETAEISNMVKPQSNPISSAKTSTTGLDNAITKEAHPAPVLNSSVKEELTQTKPEPNKMSHDESPTTKPSLKAPPSPKTRGKYKPMFGDIYKYMVGVMFLMACLFTSSHAAPTSLPSSILSSLQPSPYRTVYPLLEMETRTWAYRISEVEDAAYSIIDDACSYVAMADKQCSAVLGSSLGM